jgi:hypothetical protein
MLMSNTIHGTHLGRRMRIIPFIVDDKPCFTLVLEWFDPETKKISRDMCFQMGASEFDGLAASVEISREFRKTKKFID